MTTRLIYQVDSCGLNTTHTNIRNAYSVFSVCVIWHMLLFLVPRPRYIGQSYWVAGQHRMAIVRKYSPACRVLILYQPMRVCTGVMTTTFSLSQNWFVKSLCRDTIQLVKYLAIFKMQFFHFTPDVANDPDLLWPLRNSKYLILILHFDLWQC